MSDSLFAQVKCYLNESDGIVLGENHTTGVAPDWLRLNLEALKSEDVTTLFLELPESNQIFIDEFLSGHISEVEFRDSIGAMNDIALEDLIIEARDQGINVIAMDVNYTIPSEHRLNVANAHWKNIVETRMADIEGRYIILGGASHTNNLDNDIRHRGIDSLLDIPSIDIYSPHILNILAQHGDVTTEQRDSLLSSGEIAVQKSDGSFSDDIAVVPEAGESQFIGRYNPPSL